MNRGERGSTKTQTKLGAGTWLKGSCMNWQERSRLEWMNGRMHGHVVGKRERAVSI